MPSSAVRAFSDPDDYAASLRATTLQLTLTARGVFTGEIIRIDLSHMWMQRFCESLPQIGHSAIAPGRAVISFWTRPGSNLWNGVEVQPSHIVRHGDSEEFYRRSSAASYRAAMSLPVEKMVSVGAEVAGCDLAPPRVPLLVAAPPAAMAKLQRLHAAAGHLAQSAPEVIANPGAAHGLEQSLIETMADCLSTGEIHEGHSAIAYIHEHARGDKPFFMDINFIKMHNPTNAAPEFRGKSHLGDYSDSLMELDADIGRIMEAIRAEAPNTIVILTADNGAWLDAYPDAGTTPFRGEKGSPFEGGWRVPAIMWWPNHIPAGVQYYEMMSHIDAWATLATMVGLTPPPHDWVGNDGKPIYFDSIDNSAYILGNAPHSARNSWIYVDGEIFQGARADIGGDPDEPWVNIAWKYLYTAKDSWLGPDQNLGAIGATYNLTMDPYEKYDMTFNGAAPSRVMTTSPGRYAGQDNGWVLSLIEPVILDFDKTVMKYPSIKRFPGGASNDLVPNLQNPDNPLPILRGQPEPHVQGGGG